MAASAIIAGGAILAGVIGAQGAKSAAGDIAGGNAAAIAEQRRQFDLILGLTEPGRQTGNQALNALGSAFIPGFEGTAGFDAIDSEQLSEIFRNLPGTEFAVAEAEKSVGNSFASRGGAFGGNAIRALGDRTANLASDRVFNNLLELAGFGPRATGTAANAATNAGNNISGLLSGAGFAQAQGTLGAAGSINNAIQGGLNNFLLMNALNSGSGGDGSRPPIDFGRVP